MQINYLKILEVHGVDILELIKKNIKDVINNNDYLKKLEFSDSEDILERYPQIFICSTEEFKDKINKFIRNIGINYIEILENNMELWEKLL